MKLGVQCKVYREPCYLGGDYFVQPTPMKTTCIRNGCYHRVNGPAIEYPNGRGSYWYKDGKLHREDGPAVETSTGIKEWYVDSKRHRVDGPAVIRNDVLEWWANGKRHRLDGPAFEFKTNGETRRQWFINGVQMTKKEHTKLVWKHRINKLFGRMLFDTGIEI